MTDPEIRALLDRAKALLEEPEYLKRELLEVLIQLIDAARALLAQRDEAVEVIRRYANQFPNSDHGISTCKYGEDFLARYPAP